MRPIERARDRWKSLSTRDGCGMEPADWVRVSEMMDAYEADRKELLGSIREIAECPRNLDKATVSKKGLDNTPRWQIVFTLSVCAERLDRLDAVLSGELPDDKILSKAQKGV